MPEENKFARLLKNDEWGNLFKLVEDSDTQEELEEHEVQQQPQ